MAEVRNRRDRDGKTKTQDQDEEDTDRTLLLVVRSGTDVFPVGSETIRLNNEVLAVWRDAGVKERTPNP